MPLILVINYSSDIFKENYISILNLIHKLYQQCQIHSMYTTSSKHKKITFLLEVSEHFSLDL